LLKGEKKEKNERKIKGKKMFKYNEDKNFLKENLKIKDYLGVNSNYICSPLRQDTNPSFFITKYNTWIDYGTGERGDIFDLIAHIENITNFNEILKNSPENYNNLYNEKRNSSEKFTIELRPELRNYLLKKYPDIKVKLLEDPPGPPVRSTFMAKIK